MYNNSKYIFIIIIKLSDFWFFCAISSSLILVLGRGGNVWLSPEGCAMFSVYVKVPLHSELGRSAAYIQHLTSLAVVESITALPGYEVS